jgi:CRISPR-associated protein Cas1
MTATETALIPLRALNQITYCPRLYYLQYVDCVMPVNEHVESGLHEHRRVDAPELANKTRKEGDADKSRGIHLSSETLGLSGILDVIEEKSGESYPVETKHGSAPRDDDGRPTTWDNDAVQLCGQALLMEEAFGSPVPRGFQFYAGTRERVEVRFTDELRAKTRAAIDECRRLSALDAPPDPLPSELRHRCFGCSLAPVCLPEETAAPPAGLTRVLPQSDDGPCCTCKSRAATSAFNGATASLPWNCRSTLSVNWSCSVFNGSTAVKPW